LAKVVSTFTVVPGSTTDGADTVVLSGPLVWVTANVPASGNERDESPTSTL
jgi:hypothetical protein